ncbi:hypothetical protein ACFW4L_36595, partial [Streptomyces sp. NPDC058832]
VSRSGDRWGAVYSSGEYEGLPDPGTRFEPGDLAPALAVFRGVVVACNSYEAKGIDAPITVLRAQLGQVGEFAGHPGAAAPDWGWSALTRAGVRAESVAASHHTLLTDPAALAAVVHAVEQP